MTKPCPDCGEHRWSRDGYCLSVKCAGSVFDPHWPKTKPMVAEQPAAVTKGSPPKARIKKPPKKGRRALELQYEAQGKVAPWLEQPGIDG